MFYLTTHSTHYFYGYMASDIWLRSILIVRKETRCRHMGYSLRLTARVILYAPSHRQDRTYHGLCYTSRGALAGTRNSSTRKKCQCAITLENLSSAPFTMVEMNHSHTRARAHTHTYTQHTYIHTRAHKRKHTRARAHPSHTYAHTYKHMDAHT